MCQVLIRQRSHSSTLGWTNCRPSNGWHAPMPYRHMCGPIVSLLVKKAGIVKGPHNLFKSWRTGPLTVFLRIAQLQPGLRRPIRTCANLACHCPMRHSAALQRVDSFGPLIACVVFGPYLRPDEPFSMLKACVVIGPICGSMFLLDC